jgi:hypothetical protein
LFAKGEQLKHGLIDPNRLFNIMTKIKELASGQLERGSREIDYNEIVKYLQDKDAGFLNEQELERVG